MSAGLWRDRLAAAGLVVISLLCLMVLMAYPLKLFLPAAATPQLAMVALYFWLLWWPAGLSLAGVLLLGLLQDAMLALPFGWSALQFLLLALLVQQQNRLLRSEGFWLQWLGVAVVVGLVFGLSLLIWLAIFQHMPPLLLVVQQWLFSVAAYPIIAMLFNPLLRLAARWMAA